jgi:hypothetical protein
MTTPRLLPIAESLLRMEKTPFLVVHNKNRSAARPGSPAVDDIDEVGARMRASGAAIIGTMQYEDTYRLAYIRGPQGIIVGLAEERGGGARAPARKQAKQKGAGRRSRYRDVPC